MQSMHDTRYFGVRTNRVSTHTYSTPVVPNPITSPDLWDSHEWSHFIGRMVTMVVSSMLSMVIPKSFNLFHLNVLFIQIRIPTNRDGIYYLISTVVVSRRNNWQYIIGKR